MGGIPPARGDLGPGRPRRSASGDVGDRDPRSPEGPAEAAEGDAARRNWDVRAVPTRGRTAAEGRCRRARCAVGRAGTRRCSRSQGRWRVETRPGSRAEGDRPVRPATGPDRPGGGRRRTSARRNPCARSAFLAPARGRGSALAGVSDNVTSNVTPLCLTTSERCFPSRRAGSIRLSSMRLRESSGRAPIGEVQRRGTPDSQEPLRAPPRCGVSCCGSRRGPVSGSHESVPRAGPVRLW